MLLADQTGTARESFTTDRFDLAELRGRTVIVHENRDNHANIPDRYVTSTGPGPDADTLAAGDNGSRLRCGEVEGAVRLAGDTRVTTAIAASQSAFLDGTGQAVVLARADRFPDALAGVPLAVDRQAPLLLTGPDALDPLVEEELARALGEDGGTVYLLGGEAALSAAVEKRIEELGYEPVRLAGPTRVETAVDILEELDDVARILVVTGDRFPDALAAGPAAAANDGAVLFSLGDQP